MTKKTILEWQYKPSNYFEAPYSYFHSAYELVIKDGKAFATLANFQEPVDPTLLRSVEEKVKMIFAGRQFQTHQPFNLGGLRICQYKADGSQHVTIHASDIATLGMSGDLVMRDATGQVIRDTKAERIAEDARSLGVVMAKGQYPVLKSLLASYSAAVNDPANELVHLYEIRDALVRHFGGGSQAQKRLGITDAEWKRLGRLANAEPFEQGRHRGSFTQKRPAKQHELDEARAIARKWIKAFARLI